MATPKNLSTRFAFGALRGDAIRCGFIGAGMLAFGLTGCTNDNTERAEANLNIWRAKGPSSYTYVVEQLCFCTGVEPIRIVVEDGVVTESTGMRTGAPRSDRRQTMTELLEEVVAMTRRDSADFAAEYDPELGYLLEAQVDYEGGVADDELAISVKCFVAAVGEEACKLPTVASCSGDARTADVDAPVQRTCLGNVQPEGRVAGSDLLCCPVPEDTTTIAECEGGGGNVVMDFERTPSCWAPEVGRDQIFSGVITDSASGAVCCREPTF